MEDGEGKVRERFLWGIKTREGLRIGLFFNTGGPLWGYYSKEGEGEAKRGRGSGCPDIWKSGS